MQIVLLFAFAQTLGATDYYAVPAGATTSINEFGVCQKVTNGLSKSLMVPSKLTAEWLSFRTHLPTSVTMASCSGPTGYIVLTNSTWNGSLGYLSGANAKCATELGATSWAGKPGPISSSLIQAMLCDPYGCQSPLPLTTYNFALAGSPGVGGGTFTSDADGQAPGDSASWSDSTHFGVAATFHSGRAAGSSTLAPLQWDTNTCGSWGSSAVSGAFGDTNGTGSARWRNAGATCSTARRLVCLVHPYVTPIAGSSSGSSYNSTSGTIYGTGASTGDVVVAFVTGASGFTASTPPAGWTLAMRTGPSASNQYAEIWTKVLTASEPGSYTWTSNGTQATAMLVQVKNANTASPVESVTSSLNASSTTYTLPGTTSSTGYGLLLGFVTSLGNNTGMAAAGNLLYQNDLKQTANSVIAVTQQLGDSAHYALTRSGPLSPAAASIGMSIVIKRP